MILTEKLRVQLAPGREIAFPDLEIGESGVYLIEGDNGSGKTTLVRCLCGIALRYTGLVEIGGADVRGLKRDEIARRVSYLPQAMNPGASVEAEAFVRQGLYAGQSSAFDEVADELGVRAYFGRDIASLSGGERQLCRIARALVAETPHVILDEPDSYLGKRNRARFTALVRKLSERRGIVIVTHGAIEFTDADRLLADLSPDSEA